MNFSPYYDRTQFSEFAAKIKRDMENWQMIEVNMTGILNAAHVAYRICNHFCDKDGITLICNGKTILVLVRLGKDTNLHVTAMGIQEKMPPQSCSVTASGVTKDGIARLQLSIHETYNSLGENSTSLLAARMERTERIAMVVEDDMFIRSLIIKTLKPKAHTIERASAEHVVDAYLEYLPDIVFLDIHLPGGSGLNILKEILSFDQSAYVIITTSDSVKGNVEDAKKAGAKGFIAKNFTSEKLLDAYSRCPTVLTMEMRT